MSVYVFQARTLSVCSRVRAAMTADAGAGVEIGTVDPGFVGTTKVVADSKAYTAGVAVRGRCSSVPHPRFECTDAEHEFRYVFSSVRTLKRGNFALRNAGDDVVYGVAIC